MNIADELAKPQTQDEAPRTWVDTLGDLVEKKPIVILRFGADEWESLRQSRRGINEFTVARSHDLLQDVKTPTVALLLGRDDAGEHLCFGLVRSRAGITTLQTRIKIIRAVHIRPNTEADLLAFIEDRAQAYRFAERLASQAAVAVLSPKLGSALIQRLASIESNRGVMRAVTEYLTNPKFFRGTPALQADAVRSALRVFGLSMDDQAETLEMVKGQTTALARVGIIEDGVIEHDARSVSGFSLVGSETTGRATFKRGGETLEIITANRRSLEEAFGVDLVYLNVTRQNIAMLQYKMLEADKSADPTDWIYRPDSQLDEEIRRMKKFSTAHPPGPHEYRLNPAVFYMKFVKRDGRISKGGIITPLDHYEALQNDPICIGPRGGLRISYKSLAGRYMREAAFADLMRSGYIGAHADTTAQLMTIVNAVLNSDRAVVAAIQKTVSKSAGDDDNDILEDAFLPMNEEL